MFSPSRRRRHDAPANPRTLGDHLRKARVDRGQTLEQVARLLGVLGLTVHNWECNIYSPKPRSREKIVEFLGYDPDTSPRIPTADVRDK
jgi:transcriptional regulator with XRE-family HTH domain